LLHAVVVEGVLMVVVVAMEAGTVVVALPLDIATLIAHAVKFVSM
jgi:hypothetical protein